MTVKDFIEFLLANSEPDDELIINDKPVVIEDLSRSYGEFRLELED